jgi:hypothetical protein
MHSEHPALLHSSSMSSPRVVSLRFVTLSAAMEELGLATSAVTVMKTAQLIELMAMPEPTPVGRQVLLTRKSNSISLASSFFSIPNVD